MKRAGYASVVFWILSMIPMSVNALGCIEVTGVASMQTDDRAFARQMAIRNAIELASMQSNLEINARSDMENFALQNQASRFTTRSKVERFSLVDEFYNEQTNEYEVVLYVCLTADPSACGNLVGTQYQNRLVVAPVVIENTYEGRDIANLLPGYQAELFRRLNIAGYRNLEMVEYAQGLHPGTMVTPNLSQDVLLPIQDQTGGQFLLLSVIRSVVSVSEGRGFLDGVRRFYNYDAKHNRRYVEVEWYLVDLNKQRIVRQHLESIEMEGEPRVGRDKPFGSMAFFRTHTGQAFDKILAQQVERVIDHLKCEMLETQIIDVRNGEYVMFLADQSGIQVGDQLAIYSRAGNPVRFQGRVLGMDEAPAGFIEITRILPKFAVGRLVAEKAEIQIGDVARSW
ncbi:flagellar assembly protein T N-terminal domain-containing protein [Thiomicrospira microaerophila]|uniref:flagellar assembly protein T N-terminal domain-containing protein n=1 Tax=Thiomicrospira microaerophila TaxID=406020 RepID=UPI0005CB39E4|nr:flagellar assembly protein T N-terminal domain-containing protein [Thiomicrospira microaerophila]